MNTSIDVNTTLSESYNNIQSLLNDKKALVQLSPQEYMDLDKLCKDIKKSKKKSLTSLAQDIMGKNLSSEARIMELDAVKEDAFCFHSKVAQRKVMTGQGKKITESYLDLMESVAKNPELTYPGDMTTLAFEAGNLSHEEIYRKLIKGGCHRDLQDESKPDVTKEDTNIKSINF